MKTKTALVSLALAFAPLIACSSDPEPVTDAPEVTGSCKDKCDPNENCGTCAQDCGACKVCNDLPACTGLAAPGTFAPLAALDVKLEAMPKDQLLARLQMDFAAGTPEARLLVAALGAPQAGEHPSVPYVRAMVDAAPAIKSKLVSKLPALGVGSIAEYRARFPALPVSQVMDAPAPAATNDCAPALKIRIAKVNVHEEDDDVANDIVYCSIVTSSTAGGEIKITPKTKNLDEGKSQTFSAAEATFWGQERPRDPGGDLTVKYDCYEADTNDGYGNLVKTAADVAKQSGLTGLDSSGYTGTAVDLISKYLPVLLALDTDDHLFVAQQTLTRAQHMALAKGASWSVRKKGTHLWSDWEWSLSMESYGCAENGVKK
jgi:hypothetical protein